MSEKMCTCKACGQQVAKSAKNCPHCGAKVKKVSPILIAIIAIVAIAIIASSGGKDSSDNVAGTTPTKVQFNNTEVTGTIAATEVETPLPETTEKKSDNAYGVGDVAELKNVQVSLLSITESTGSSFNQPSEGNVFVLCEFEIQNNTKEELNISSMLSFEAYCDEYVCNYSLGALMEKENSSQLDGTIASGKKMKGVVGYEVPADWNELEVHFTPNVWIGKEIVFVAVND